MLPETPLATLFQTDRLSARLGRMIRETDLGKMGLRSYLANRQDLDVRMLRTPNCGMRSVGELRSLVLAHVQTILSGRAAGNREAENNPNEDLPSEHPINACPDFIDAGGTWPRDSALALLPDTPLGQLLRPDGLSARLDRVLRETNLGELGLNAYVSDRAQVDARMLRTPNCGRRSISELRASVCAHVYHILSAAGLGQAEARASAEDLMAAHARTEPHIAGPPEGLGLEDIIDWHLSRLKPRSKEILSRRFGLKGTSRQTLEEVGRDLQVTRERIRQVEAKELRRTRQLCARFPLTPHLEDERERLAGALFGDRIYVKYAEVDAFSRQLDGYIRLAIEVVDRRPIEWLMSGAYEAKHGYLRQDADHGLFQDCAHDLVSRSADAPMPRSIASLTAGLDAGHAAAAVDIALGWHVAHKYVFRRRPGRRALRTALLHALLATDGRPQGVADLLTRYHQAAPNDLCSDRDLIIVMEQAPHLFLEIEEARWSALGPCGEPPATFSRGLEASSPPEEEDTDDGTLSSALERALRERGPTRVSTLLDDALDIVPAGRSPRSIGPTLLMNPSRFVRALPGVWALCEQIPDEDELARADDIAYLLNATQARVYALARHAGEPWGAYPLWTPTAEMRLCRWARRHGESELLMSLLAVATIESWPTAHEDKARWTELRERGARFELCFEPRPTCFALTPARVLALALALDDHGTLGWITVNRVLRYQACAHIAAKVLDTLNRTGVTLPPSGAHAWQRPHEPGPRLSEWIERLTDVIHRAGNPDWQHEDLRSVSEGFTAGAPDNSVVLPVEEMDELESLMADHRRAMQMRRLQEQLEDVQG